MINGKEHSILSNGRGLAEPGVSASLRSTLWRASDACAAAERTLSDCCSPG